MAIGFLRCTARVVDVSEDFDEAQFFFVSIMATNYIRLMNDHLICSADACQVFAMVGVAISQ